MSIKQNLIKKYENLSAKKPIGTDLTNIDPVQLFQEVELNDRFKNWLEKFGKIFEQLEGLKQLHGHCYKNYNKEELLAFKEAIFYNELVQIQVFFELIKDIEITDDKYPNLKKIVENKNNTRLNKIRNAISHFDWSLEDKYIIFKDRNFIQKIEYLQISDLSSLISIIAIFMTNNIEELMN